MTTMHHFGFIGFGLIGGSVAHALREQYPDSEVQIAKLYDIDTDYWYLFVNHNYFIYRVEKDKVIVLQIFNEKEDFMQSLFGITGRTQESIDYWGE